MRRILIGIALGTLVSACAAPTSIGPAPAARPSATPSALATATGSTAVTGTLPATARGTDVDLRATPGGAQSGSCSAISDSARKTADAYAEMLEAEGLTSTKVFVSARAVDDLGSPTTEIDPAALRCLWGQHLNIVIVSGPDDPTLPVKPGPGIRALPDGPLVMFGRLALPRDRTTHIAIDNGSGDWRSVGYDVTVDATNIARVTRNGHMAIS